MAAVVPKTASGAVLRLADGNEKDLDIVDGVVIAAATGKASVSFRIGAHTVSVPLHSDLACVQVDNDDPAPTEDQKRAVQGAGMRFCKEVAPPTGRGSTRPPSSISVPGREPHAARRVRRRRGRRSMPPARSPQVGALRRELPGR